MVDEIEPFDTGEPECVQAGDLPAMVAEDLAVDDLNIRHRQAPGPDGPASVSSEVPSSPPRPGGACCGESLHRL